MSNQNVTLLVGVVLGIVALAAFGRLVVAPAVGAYQRPFERAAAVVLSLYVLGALVGLGVLAGAWIVLEWPRVF